jgi:uncharacterized membrane protein (DUF485 family)
VLNLLIISTSKYQNITSARAIYVAVDPFSLKSIFPRTLDRILHELIFATSVSLFLVLLLVWHGLSTAFDIDRHIQRSQKVKNKKCRIWRYETVHTLIIVVLFLCYPVQITFSYFRGARGFENGVVDAVLIAVMSVVISFIIVFFVYTCRFKYAISKSNEAPIKHQIKELRKSMYTNKFTYVPNIQINENDIKEFLKEAEDKGNIHLIRKYIIDVDQEVFNDNEDLSDYDMELEDELINVDLNYNNHKDESRVKHEEVSESLALTVQSDNNLKTPIKKIVSLASNREREISLKKNDINVLNKIFGLSYLIIGVGIAIIILGLILIRTNILDNPSVSV